MSERSDYGTALLNAKEEYDRDAAEARLVFSFPVKFGKDGNMWSCLLGDNLMEGVVFFSKSPMGAIEKMRAYIYTGELKESEDE